VAGINISASASNGKPGMWLLDPADVTISAAADSSGLIVGGFFAPTTGSATANVDSGLLQVLLNAGTSVTITTTNTGIAGAPPSGRGDINVNAVLTWSLVGAAPNSTLTLNAAGDVNINSAINPTQGNLVVCCGRDVNVNAPITMVRGSMLLSAGRDVNQFAAITSTDGNIAMCAGRDINVTAAMSSTRGTVIADRSLASLGVLQGLTFTAGNAATGPGLAGGGGAVNITPPGGTVTVVQSAVVGEEVPVRVIYNPLNYVAAAINYSISFTTFNPLTVQRLVFPGGANKVFDGSTTATFTSLQGSPAGVTLAGTGTFASTGPGVNIPITYSGLALGGASAGFALPAGCCGAVTTTFGDITALIPVVPPVVVVPPAVVVAPLAVILEQALVQETVSPNIAPVLPGLSLAVLEGGIRMPPILVADATPVPTQAVGVAPPVEAIPIAVPPELPPPVYVPPVRPRKPDRN
jgi:hypothetical protein